MQSTYFCLFTKRKAPNFSDALVKINNVQTNKGLVPHSYQHKCLPNLYG